MKNRKNIVGVLITDTHKKQNNLELVKSVFKQCRDFCLDNDVKNVFHLGDWFTERSKQSLECLLSTDECIKMFTDHGIKLYAIQGNHDKTDQTSELGYVSLYNSVGNKNFTLVEDHGIVELCGLSIHLLPYFKEHQYLQNLLGLIESDDSSGKKILLTHQSINGVRNNDGTLVNGDLSLDIFKQYNKVFVGHYHDEQKYNNIHYIGSAYQANFGESYEDKGFTVLYDDLTTKKINTKFPKYIHHKVEVSDIEYIEDINQMYSSDNNDFVRVTLIGQKDDIKNFDKSKLSINNIEVRTQHTDLELFTLKDNLSSVIFSKKDLMKRWVEYSTKHMKNKQLMMRGFNMIKNTKDVEFN